MPGAQCSDLDGGLNYLEKSTADDRINGVGNWHEDTCLLRVPCKEGDPGYGSPGSCLIYTKVDECSGDLCNLQEGYCTGGKSSNIAVTCQNGCRNGTCMLANSYEPPIISSFLPVEKKYWNNERWFKRIQNMVWRGKTKKRTKLNGNFKKLRKGWCKFSRQFGSI